MLTSSIKKCNEALQLRRFGCFPVFPVCRRRTWSAWQYRWRPGTHRHHWLNIFEEYQQRKSCDYAVTLKIYKENEAFISQSVCNDVRYSQAIVRIKEIVLLSDSSPVFIIEMTVGRLSSNSSRKTSCQMSSRSSDKTLRKSLFEKFLTINKEKK